MSVSKFIILLGKLLLIAIILLIGAMIFHKSLDYYQPDFSKGYLSDKEVAFGGVFKYGLYAHIIAAPLALFIGTFQIMFRYERRWAAGHRWLGIAYALLILLLAAPGGLIMAQYALGGIWGVVGFSILSVLWFAFTLKAWRTARAGQYALHRQYMLRSYVLTVSAVSLRLLAFVFIHYLHRNSAEAYLLISWLSWLPQLLLLEGWLYIERKKDGWRLAN